jgi:hypothetical protein
VIRASGEGGNGTGIAEGTKVKVTAEVKVYHAPKQADGINLQGKEGVIVKNVAYYKDKHLSPNLPYKVEIDIGNGGKPKFFVHLVSRGGGVRVCLVLLASLYLSTASASLQPLDGD